MPNTARGGGISRKITSAGPQASQGSRVGPRRAGGHGDHPAHRRCLAHQAEVKRDFEYLMRMWETVRDMTLKSQAPTLVYEEGSLIKRSIRDLYNKDIDEIIVAGEAGYRKRATS
jgi:ribonuclease E